MQSYYYPNRRRRSPAVPLMIGVLIGAAAASAVHALAPTGNAGPWRMNCIAYAPEQAPAPLDGWSEFSRASLTDPRHPVLICAGGSR